MMGTMLLEGPPGEEAIGVRELRQRAANILDEVARGRAVTVTRNGRPVARLVPVAAPDDLLDALVTSGSATRAEDPGDLLDVIPAPATGGELPSSVLARMRDEERW